MASITPSLSLPCLRRVCGGGCLVCLSCGTGVEKMRRWTRNLDRHGCRVLRRRLTILLGGGLWVSSASRDPHTARVRRPVQHGLGSRSTSEYCVPEQNLRWNIKLRVKLDVYRWVAGGITARACVFDDRSMLPYKTERRKAHATTRWKTRTFVHASRSSLHTERSSYS
jgi:hypothetical protein